MNLSADIIYTIMTFLDLESICTFSVCCKQIHSVTSSARGIKLQYRKRISKSIMNYKHEKQFFFEDEIARYSFCWSWQQQFHPSFPYHLGCALHVFDPDAFPESNEYIKFMIYQVSFTEAGSASISTIHGQRFIDIVVPGADYWIHKPYMGISIDHPLSIAYTGKGIIMIWVVRIQKKKIGEEHRPSLNFIRK